MSLEGTGARCRNDSGKTIGGVLMATFSFDFFTVYRWWSISAYRTLLHDPLFADWPIQIYRRSIDNNMLVINDFDVSVYISHVSDMLENF